MDGSRGNNQWTKPSLDELTAVALEAATGAYCPYSGFHVGAAVWADGKIYSGCNIESASFGLSLCAERVAIFKAVSEGCRAIEMLAVVTPDSPPEAPAEARICCGACRQILAEFMADDAAISIQGVGEITLQELLPTPFRFKKPEGT